MRKLEIHPNGETFSAGDNVQGHILVTCEKDFQCEHLSISLHGVELARVVIHAGKVTIVHEEKREHFDQSIVFGENLMIPMGESRYEFSFSLPTEIPGSYVGTYGSIKFKLYAKAEIKWARDLKYDVDLHVPFEYGLQTEYVTNPKSGSIMVDGNPLLRVEIDQDQIALGNQAPFRFSVDRLAKIRGVRTEIIREEHVEPKGYKMNTKRTLVEEYFPDEEIVRESWIESAIRTNPRWTPSFSSDLIQIRYFLKVTLDIPLRLDSVIEIPIFFVRSENLGSSVEL